MLVVHCLGSLRVANIDMHEALALLAVHDEWTLRHCDKILEIYRRIYNDEEKQALNNLTDKITIAVEEYREKMSKLNERR